MDGYYLASQRSIPLASIAADDTVLHHPLGLEYDKQFGISIKAGYQTLNFF